MSTVRTRFYVTTPIYYANARPHIGTLYSTVLADVAARWNRAVGREVFFLTGTDEHGQKLAEAAAKAGVAPQTFVDSVVPRFYEVWERYAISYDRFIRTSEYAHKQTVTRWINEAMQRGDIYKGSYEGRYCVPCETFVSADQELCPSCNRGLETVQEENYFFRLSAYQERLLAFYESHPDFIQPRERRNEVIAFVSSGLRDLSISRRTVSWGIPFPGDSEHTVYVWADALLNYLSALGYLRSEQSTAGMMEKFWPADVQVMAKDIVKFHAAYLPAFLMAAGIEPASKLLVHGYILVDNDKMSKSKGNVLDPLTLADTYGVDAIRYYLTRFMHPAHDGNFSFADLENAFNADLANNLGNLLHRVTLLAQKYDAATVVPPTRWSVMSENLRQEAATMAAAYYTHMEEQNAHYALQELFKFSTLVNGYFHERQPWVLAKSDRAAFEETLAATCQSLYLIAHLLAPVMPTKALNILAALGHTLLAPLSEVMSVAWATPCTLIAPREPLFARIEKRDGGESVGGDTEQAGQSRDTDSEKKNSTHTTTQENTPMASVDKTIDAVRSLEASVSEAHRERVEANSGVHSPVIASDGAVAKVIVNEMGPMIGIEDFLKVSMIVGQIIDCNPVEKSEKLYRLTVDLGENAPRTILAGIAQYYTREELIDKKGVFVANLAPRKLCGVVSEGMTLCAKEADGRVVMLSVGHAVPNGTRIS